MPLGSGASKSGHLPTFRSDGAWGEQQRAQPPLQVTDMILKLSTKELDADSVGLSCPGSW